MALRFSFDDTAEVAVRSIPLPHIRTLPPFGDRKPANDQKVFCPVCGAEAAQEQCKLVCRSKICVYRVIVF